MFFNGKKAGRSFERLVRSFPAVQSGTRTTTLPSTSPANAGMTLDGEPAAWSAVRDALDEAEGQAHSSELDEGFEHSSTGGISSAP